MNSGLQRWVLLPLGLSLLLGAALPALSNEPEATRSGFLSNYSLLKPGEEGQAQLVYRNPSADLTQYDKILFDRVSIWVTLEGGMDEVSSEDFQRLADDLYSTIRSRLEDDYKIVDQPGAGVMRIYLALTHVSDAEPEYQVFSSVGSTESVPTGSGELAPRTRAFVNEADIEIEAVDSQSGETLVEALDPWTRQTRLEAGSLDSWAKVHEAFEFWAKRIDTRLDQARRGEI